jgi:hypothetical protein
MDAFGRAETGSWLEQLMSGSLSAAGFIVIHSSLSFKRKS